MRLSLAVAMFVGASASTAKAEFVGTTTCSGIPYHVKSETAEVLRLPELSSKVVRQLQRRDRICYIGERDEFAYLQWDTPPGDDDGPRSTAFILKSAIEPTGEVVTTPQRDKPLEEKVRDFYYNIQSGSVSEDALAPIRPLLKLFGQPASPWERSPNLPLRKDGKGGPE